MREFGSLDVRPHQLMLIVSKIGSGCKDDLGDAGLTEILWAVRKNSSLPVTLRCPVTSNYYYQNPPEIAEAPADRFFYARCDLKILQRMGMVPGATRPAVEIFHRLLEGVETAQGILYFNEITSPSWKGLGQEGYDYDKGRAMGLQAIIPARDKKEEEQFKVDSARLMYKADKLQIRPHHLMCMTCFYGRQDFVPIAADNLFEAIDIIHANPDIPVELVCGPCMICPPCYYYCPSSGQCVSQDGMALRDELKDLDVLQILGLKYGDVLSARELFTRLYNKVYSTTQICGYGDGIARSPEWSSGCAGKEGNPAYVKARAAGLGFLDPLPLPESP